ncbi:acetyltransferase [Aeromonas veronii]|uniref:acetyltransferase n=1 Tax=Aeromonas veronii TaxID=654 RepID=UPI00366B07F6
MKAKSVSKHPLGPCAILGASGHGKVIADIAELNGYSDIHFYDDRWPKLTQVEHWPVRGNSERLFMQVADYANIVVGIGNNAIRLEKYQRLFALGASCLPLVHPRAVISCYASLGIGSVVMAGAVINPCSHIGKACIINTAATVDHDCGVADGVHISPGVHLAGGVTVAEASWIGIGANIKPLIKIGSNAVVGAGAAVIHDVLDNQTVAGVPAKPICRKE